MKEQQAVLDFFSQAENLPLGLAVAEQMDTLREQMNTQFWQALQARLDSLIKEHTLPWQVTATEDRNAAGSLVGLYCSLRSGQKLGQELYLSPMMEQQHLGSDWRIYFGLMWSVAPTPKQLALPAVITLKKTLQQAGFKNNESHLAWQWTMMHPRRKDFLLRYSHQPEILLAEVQGVFKALLIDNREVINQANESLKSAPRLLASSFNQMRNELLD